MVRKKVNVSPQILYLELSLGQADRETWQNIEQIVSTMKVSGTNGTYCYLKRLTTKAAVKGHKIKS